jgi:hypothetical protein
MEIEFERDVHHGLFDAAHRGVEPASGGVGFFCAQPRFLAAEFQRASISLSNTFSATSLSTAASPGPSNRMIGFAFMTSHSRCGGIE